MMYLCCCLPIKSKEESPQRSHEDRQLIQGFENINPLSVTSDNLIIHQSTFPIDGQSNYNDFIKDPVPGTILHALKNCKSVRSSSS